MLIEGQFSEQLYISPTMGLVANGCYFCLFQQAQAKKEEPVTPALSESIPKFYFPQGQPQANINIDNLISKIEKIFSQFPDERVTIKDMGLVAKVSVVCYMPPLSPLQIVHFV